MELRRDWRAILKYAWSVRLMAIAALLSGVEVMIQVMTAFGVRPPIHDGIFAALAGCITIAALVARVVMQQRLHVDG